jgi:hypothetical protein
VQLFSVVKSPWLSLWFEHEGRLLGAFNYLLLGMIEALVMYNLSREVIFKSSLSR